MSEVQISVDVVIFTTREGQLQLRLVRRDTSPYEGSWAIPGGLVLAGESLDQAARRRLLEETGVADGSLEQLYTFGEPGRDPRGRVITVAYYALVSGDHILPAGSDAHDAAWWPVSKLPSLAFDHAEILAYAIARLRNKLEYTTMGFRLLPESFTLTDLQRVYEMILGRRLDKRNFRRKIDVLGILTPLNETRHGGRSRPARLYRLAVAKY